MTRKTKYPRNAGKGCRTSANTTGIANANANANANVSTGKAIARTTTELNTSSSSETANTTSSTSYRNLAASTFESLHQQITPGRRYAECRNRLVHYRNSVVENSRRNAESFKSYAEHYIHETEPPYHLIYDLFTSYAVHALALIFSATHWEEFFAFVRGRLAENGVIVDDEIEDVQADEKEDGQRDETDPIQEWLEGHADME